MNLIPLYLIIYLYETVYAHCRSVRILLAMFLYMLTIHDVCISMYNTFVYLIVLEKAINITPKKSMSMSCTYTVQHYIQIACLTKLIRCQ